MHAVHIRIILYVLSTLLGMIPASWAGLVSYDATAGMIQISVEGLAVAAGAGLALAGGVFKRWGTR